MRHFFAVFLVAALAWPAEHARAAAVTLDFAASVGVTHSYIPAPLPPGIVRGAPVSGRITFDPTLVLAPKYEYVSCSGSCGGGSVSATFGLPSGARLDLSVAGLTFSSAVASLYIVDNHITPGVRSQLIGIHSGLVGIDPLLSFSLEPIVPTALLFTDINSLDGIDFGNLRVRRGNVQVGRDAYYFDFNAALPVPEPAGPALFLLALAILAAVGAAQAALARPLRHLSI